MINEKAVIDRFEGQFAVINIGDSGRQLVIPRSSLPHEAIEGNWLKVELDGDSLISATIDLEETEIIKQRILEKLDKLRRGVNKIKRL